MDPPLYSLPPAVAKRPPPDTTFSPFSPVHTVAMILLTVQFNSPINLPSFSLLSDYINRSFFTKISYLLFTSHRYYKFSPSLGDMSYSYGRTASALYDCKELAHKWTDLQTQDQYDYWTIYHGTFGLNQVTHTKLNTGLSGLEQISVKMSPIMYSRGRMANLTTQFKNSETKNEHSRTQSAHQHNSAFLQAEFTLKTEVSCNARLCRWKRTSRRYVGSSCLSTYTI